MKFLIFGGRKWRIRHQAPPPVLPSPPPEDPTPDHDEPEHAPASHQGPHAHRSPEPDGPLSHASQSHAPQSHPHDKPDVSESPTPDASQSPAPNQDNWTSLPVELQYLVQLIRYRLALEFHRAPEPREPVMPPYNHWNLPIGKFISDYNLENKPLSPDEARLLLIGLVHHVQPDLFDHTIDSMLNGAGDFPKIGGTRGKNFRGFMPTGETALFLLAGDDWQQRLAIQQLFWADHPFAKRKILWIEETEKGEPAMSGKINLSQDYVDVFTQGRTVPPHFSLSFPAKLVTTERRREDLVINDHLNSQVNDLLDWIKFNKGLVAKGGQDGRFRSGYRCLFYGPSGTGKTFAASLLGKETGKDVYRIDLSMVVSKYIGETEKNLELLFARAENKKWILFFDEADALFGKRTNVRDAHDKYANQEVSYLLQRIEDYDGLVILATNMKNNIDDAFIRRFNAILKFPMPDPDERKKIWQNTFPRGAIFKKSLATEPLLVTDSGDLIPSSPDLLLPSPDLIPPPPPGRSQFVDVPELVKKYALSGGNIANIVHYASIKGAKRQEEYNRNRQPQEGESPLTIYLPDVIDGIRRELSKDGVPFA